MRFTANRHHTSLLFALVIFCLGVGEISALLSSQRMVSRRGFPLEALRNGPTNTSDSNRRSALQLLFGVASFLTQTFPLSAGAQQTNSNSLHADTAVDRLIPIIMMEQEMETLIGEWHDMKRNNNINALTLCKHISDNPRIPSQEKDFKALLDNYSQPVSYKTKFMNQNAFLVYYTQGYDGPNRPSIETDSDQEALQKRQYGARNDAWVSWDNTLAAAEDPILQKSQDPNEIAIEVITPLTNSFNAIHAYLNEAPSSDLEQALNRLKKK